MKYLACFAILLFLISCKKNPKDTLKFVNDQNDGFNAFSITLRDDNTYKREDFGSSNTGKYTISNNIISLDDSLNGEKIFFDKTTLGCVYNASYISKDNSFAMRVIFDSLFCKPISNKKLVGNWKYENNLLTSDTLQLNDNGTAKFRGSAYSKWDFNNPQIYLSENNMSKYLLIQNLKEDSLWFNTNMSIDKGYSVKAIRLK